MWQLVRKLPGAVVDLILPPSCPSCRAAVADCDALCARCWAAIRFIDPPYCPVLGTPFSYDLGDGILSAEALADPPPFRRARSSAVFGEVTRSLVHQVKYHDRPDLALLMAKAMHRAGRTLLAECSLIVPVPLHRARLWRRRFNQSAVICTHLARMSGLAHNPLALERIKRTRQQVGLNAAQRQDNMRGAFRVRDGQRPAVADRAVLLVDDVYTSGATVKAATRSLLRAGASSVDVLTFARVVA